MLDFEREDLDRSGPWPIVLADYERHQQELRRARKEASSQELAGQGDDGAEQTSEASNADPAKADEFNGWVPRLPTIAGVEDESLSRLHGRLIAVGFLKFQLGNRTTGLCYQLSPEGRVALERSRRPAGQEVDSESEAEPLDENGLLDEAESLDEAQVA